jgi:hypothetical protein
VTTPRKIRRKSYAAHMEEMINLCIILVGKMKVKEKLERFRCGWEDNTKICVK